MTDKVAALAVAEEVQMDSAQLRRIVTELGEVAGESVIQLALEQMAMTARTLCDLAQQGCEGQVIAQAEKLSRMAWQLGLVSLAGVAVDVADCAKRGDAVALGATAARMLRLANVSLTGIWDCDWNADSGGG